jgi:hypothetical protein
MKVTIIFQYLKLKKLNLIEKNSLYCFFVYIQTFLRIFELFLIGEVKRQKNVACLKILNFQKKSKYHIFFGNSIFFFRLVWVKMAPKFWSGWINNKNFFFLSNSIFLSFKYWKIIVIFISYESYASRTKSDPNFEKTL